MNDRAFFFLHARITYSMGDVFLQPMMQQLNKERGPVGTIFGILPAVTLATGKEWREKRLELIWCNECLGPIATIFTNTHGCRKVTIVGACLAAIGFLLSYLWTNLWFYYLSIGIIGGRYWKNVYWSML